MRVLLDTSPLVALLNRRDAFHAWSIEQASELPARLYTCEAVITEAHFLLAGVYQGNERLIQLMETEKLDLSFSVADHAKRIGTLMRTYGNVPMAFADACLVCMAEQEASRIFTLDSDFHIYRKYQKETLDLISP